MKAKPSEEPAESKAVGLQSSVDTQNRPMIDS